MSLSEQIKTIINYWPIYTIGAAVVAATVTVTIWSFNLSESIFKLERGISDLDSETSRLGFNISLSQINYDIDKGKYEEALNTISGLLQDKRICNNDRARLYLLQGDAYYGMMQCGVSQCGMKPCSHRARLAYKVAYEESKDNPGMEASALLARSQVLISCDFEDDWRTARKELNSIKDRFTTEVRLNLALIHLLCKEFDDASKMYDAIIKECKEINLERSTCITALIGRGLADALGPNGDISAAIRRFSETVSQYPESKILFRGSCMKERQQQHQYQRCLEKLEELSSRKEYIDFLEELDGS